MFKPYCGIDFGTSNSTVGCMHQGMPGLVPLEHNHLTLPSAIFFNFQSNGITFGREAVADYVDGEFGRLMRSLKSVLGSKLMHEKAQIKAERMAYLDIISRYLSELKQRSETATHQCFEQVVLGRPVQFVDDDPAADKQAQDGLEQAARSAGFKHIEFQFEPIAAAMNYEQSVHHEELALIVDLGGGTSDFTVVRIRPAGTSNASSDDRRSDLLATHGVHIGGTDFDKSLSLSGLMPYLGYKSLLKADGGKQLTMPASYYFDLATWHKIHSLYDPKVLTELKGLLKRSTEPHKLERLQTVISQREGHRLAMTTEEAKIALSSLDDHVCDLDFLEHELSATLTLVQLEEALAYQADNVRTAARHTVKQAGVAESQITKLFMTGGSTAIPAVRRRIIEAFPHADVVDGDRFGSVGLGLATEAARRFA